MMPISYKVFIKKSAENKLSMQQYSGVPNLGPFAMERPVLLFFNFCTLGFELQPSTEWSPIYVLTRTTYCDLPLNGHPSMY